MSAPSPSSCAPPPRRRSSHEPRRVRAPRRARRRSNTELCTPQRADASASHLHRIGRVRHGPSWRSLHPRVGRRRLDRLGFTRVAILGPELVTRLVRVHLPVVLLTDRLSTGADRGQLAEHGFGSMRSSRLAALVSSRMLRTGHAPITASDNVVSSAVNRSTSSSASFQKSVAPCSYWAAYGTTTTSVRIGAWNAGSTGRHDGSTGDGRAPAATGVSGSAT